ncbi:MAG: hypothetical protein CMH07_07650 [Marinovum sp.]|nr:hypothetical protein [Marinovum sp.]MBQ66773.1 hypothetical protein [Marinovum sp.]
MPDGESQPWARVSGPFLKLRKAPNTLSLACDLAPLQNSRDTDVILISLFWGKSRFEQSPDRRVKARVKPPCFRPF